MDYYSQYSQPQPPPPPLQPQSAPQHSYDPSQSHSYDPYYGYYSHQQQYATTTTAVASSYHQQNNAATTTAVAPGYDQQNAAAAYDQYVQQYYSNYAPYQQPPVASQDSAQGTEPPQMLNSSAQIIQQQSLGDASGSGAVPPGLNPAAAAAVAALSQLSEFAESMEARERAMMQERQWQGQGGESVVMPLGGGMVKRQYGHHYQHQYSIPPQYGAIPVYPEARRSKGRGQRGGRSLKVSGVRGNIGRHSIGLNAEASHSQGRGRGGRTGKRGGGKRFDKSISEKESPHSATASLPSTALARHLLPPVAWCDICRVDCNTPEILEQHKNGKRHKKTVQKLEEIEAREKMLAENDATEREDKTEREQNQSNAMIESQAEVNKTQTEQDQSSALIELQVEVTDQPEITEAEENKSLEGGQDDSNHEPLVNRNASEPEKGNTNINEQSEGGKVDDTAENLLTKVPAKRTRMDGNDRKYHKRKMTSFGRGGKMLRNSEPLHKRPKARHPNQENWICTLCNVVCDTQAILQCHFAGKKHSSNIKNYHGKGVTYQPQDYFAANQAPANASQYPVHSFQGPQPIVMAAQMASTHDGYATASSEAYQYAGPAGFGYGPSRDGMSGVQATEGIITNPGLKESTYESANVQSVANSTV